MIITSMISIVIIVSIHIVNMYYSYDLYKYCQRLLLV